MLCIAMQISKCKGQCNQDANPSLILLANPLMTQTLFRTGCRSCHHANHKSPNPTRSEPRTSYIPYYSLTQEFRTGKENLGLHAVCSMPSAIAHELPSSTAVCTLQVLHPRVRNRRSRYYPDHHGWMHACMHAYMHSASNLWPSSLNMCRWYVEE